jgi:hypothetical protein
MKAEIKLLVIIDAAIDYLPQIEEALEKQKQDYLTATQGEVDVSWIIKRQDLSHLPWMEYGYGADNYGISTAWIRQDTSQISGDYYSIAYVIKDTNWTTQGNKAIAGWSVGFYSGYHVQLIKGFGNNVEANYRTFLMELMHSWNEYSMAKLGTDFNKLFSVLNWDEDVVHGRHPDYTVFKYIPVIQKIKDILIQLFIINNKTMTWGQINKLSLLTFKRPADESMRGYEGKDFDFVADEFLKSKENDIYTPLFRAVKDIENWARGL